MRNKNCKTSAKSLFQSQESKVSPIEENDAALEEIETIESGTEDTQDDNSIHSVTHTATANNLETLNESIENEMTNMLPNVLNELSEYGLETDLPAFLQLVCENRFPFSNIAFQLGLEIVRWYRQDSSTTMRYMDKTKMFWKIRVANICIDKKQFGPKS